MSHMLRLNSLKLKRHPVLGDIEIDFQTTNFDFNTIFSTIIIGQNGTGKSTVLKVLADIFRAFDLYQMDISKRPQLGYNFYVRYTINNISYDISTSALVLVEPRGRYESTYMFFKNKPVDLSINSQIHDSSSYKKYSIPISEVVLPSIVLASSLMLTDKFNAKSLGKYKYLGVRNENSPSTTGTRTYVRKTVDNIIDGIKHKNFALELTKLFKFLELDASLRLSYVPRHKNIFFTEDINIAKLRAAFGEEWKSFFPKRNSPLWGAANFEKISTDTHRLEGLVDFLKSVHRRIFVDGNKRSLEYDVLERSWEIVEDYEMLNILRSLDIISYPTLSISRNRLPYEFINSSSGETHMISEFIGLLSQIKENSLVLIDEPEISLHPNWQIKYIDQLKNIFHDYVNSHFVIATHSHFLLSDVKPTSANTIEYTKHPELALNYLIFRRRVNPSNYYLNI